MVPSDFVPSPCCCCPMHTRDSQGEEAGNDNSSPDEVYPMTTPMEEKSEGNQASSNRNTSSTEDMWPAELEPVVCRSIVSEVVHLGDSRTSTHAANEEGRVSSEGMFAALVEFVGDQES
jgi:hypothetical protein